MPTNLYGPGDNFDLTSSHVVPALMRKFHDAKVQSAESATVWGTGTPRREFLHVDDLADACLFLMEHYDGDEHINVGTGEDLSIRELAEMRPRHRRAGRHDRVRRVEAGRHAAQAARREPAARPRVAPPHRRSARARLDLRMVPRALNGADARSLPFAG